jgi:predicted alpha/beta superfamily hydrolase
MRPVSAWLAAASVIAVATVPLGAQRSETTSVVRYAIASTLLGEERPVVVFLPESYRLTSARYPVLVVLDGDDAVGPTVGAIARELADLIRGSVPELLVVAVPNRNRDRDLTPGVPVGRSGPANPAPSGDPRRASTFLQFIEQELLPSIDRRFRTEPARFLVGHSAGGLFATYAFIERPELFRGVIAASPALWRDDFVWVEPLRQSLTTRPAKPHWLVVTKGEQDHPLIHASFDRARAVLRTTALQLSKQHGWHPGAFEGCYSFLQSKEDTPVALKCATDALQAAKRAGYWTGELEVVVSKLRRAGG